MWWLTELRNFFFGPMLSDILRAAYQKDNILPKLIEDERLPIHYVDEHYVSLEVLTDDGQPAGLTQDVNTLIETQGIFDKIDSSEKTWILLLGDAGTGKTTLMHYLAHMWGSDCLKSQTIQYVFRVRLRRLLAEGWNDYLKERSNHKLSEHTYYKFARFLEYCLIKDQDLPQKNLFDTIIARLIEKPQNSFLFLLDGYDEVFHLDTVDSRSELYTFIKIIKTFPKVILTSRPNAIAPTLSSEFNVKLKNVGFTDDHIKEYISKYFGEDRHAIQTLSQFLEINQSIKELCYTPINLTLVCLIWSDEASQKNIRLSDGKLSVLYQEIILWMCRRYLDKVEGVPVLTIADETAESLLVHPVVNFLKKLAFDTINNSQELIDSTLINNLLLSHRKAITDEFTSSAIEKLEALRAVNKFGVLKAEGAQRNLTKVSHEFIHKSFKEWLCASYLRDGLLGSQVYNEGAVFDVVDYIAEHGGDASHFMVMKFLSGLIIETGKHDTIVKFWEAIWSSQTSNEERIVVPGEKSVLLLMQLLSQAVLNGNVHPSVPKHITDFVDGALWDGLPHWEKDLAESRYLSAGIVGKLLKELDSNEMDCEIRALNTLEHLRIPSCLRDQVIASIFAKTKSTDENIVEAAVYALYAMVHEAGVMDLMYEILDEGSERAVIIAMELLSQSGGLEVADKIIRKLDDLNSNIVVSALIRIGGMGHIASEIFKQHEKVIDEKLKSLLKECGSDQIMMVAINSLKATLGMIRPQVEFLMHLSLGNEANLYLSGLELIASGKMNTLETMFAELDFLFAHLDPMRRDFDLLLPAKRVRVILIKKIVSMDIKLSVEQTISLVSAVLNALENACSSQPHDNFRTSLVSSYLKIDQLYTEKAIGYLLGSLNGGRVGVALNVAAIVNMIYHNLSEELTNKLLQGVSDCLRAETVQIEDLEWDKQLSDGMVSVRNLGDCEIRYATSCLFSLLRKLPSQLTILDPRIIAICIMKTVDALVELLLDENHMERVTVGGISVRASSENYIKHVYNILLLILYNKDDDVKARTFFAISLWVKKFPVQITHHLLSSLSWWMASEEWRTNKDFKLNAIVAIGSISDEIPKLTISLLVEDLIPLLQDDSENVRRETAYLIAVLKQRWDLSSLAEVHDISATIIDWPRAVDQLYDCLQAENDENVKEVFSKVIGAVKALAVPSAKNNTDIYRLYSRNDVVRERAFLNLVGEVGGSWDTMSFKISSNRSIMMTNEISTAIKSSSLLIDDEDRNEILALIERRKNGERMSSISEPLRALSARLRNLDTRVIRRNLIGRHLLSIIKNNQVNKDALLEFAQWIQKEKLDCKIAFSSIEVGGHDLSKSSGYAAATVPLRIQFAQLFYGELKLAGLAHAVASHSSKAFSLLDQTIPLGLHTWRVSVLKFSKQAVTVILEQSILSHVVVKKFSLEGAVSSERPFTAPLNGVTKAFRAEVFGALNATTVGLAYEVAAMTLSNEEVNDLMDLFQSLDVDQILQSLKTLHSETERNDQKGYSVNLLMHRELLGMTYEDGIRSLEERVTVMGARVTAIDNELETLKTIILEKASQLDQLLEHQQTSINVIEERIHSQGENINFVSLDVSALRGSIQQLATEVNNVRLLTEDIRVQGARLASTFVNHHCRELDAIKDKIEEQQKEIGHLASILDTHTADIDLINRLLAGDIIDADFTSSIVGNIYKETLYHNLVKQLHNVGLASSMVQTGIFVSAQTGMTGKVGQLFSIFSSSIPIVGIGAKICGTILKAADGHWQGKMLMRFANLGNVTEMNQLFKSTAQSLMREPSELDQALLNKPKSLGDKIYDILSAASDVIINVASNSVEDLSVMVMEGAASELESLHEAVEQETEEGEKHAALIVSVITAHVYRGDAECVANATSSLDQKVKVLRSFVLRSYGMIRGSVEIFARDILARVKAELSVQIACSTKEKHLKREDKFVVVFSDRLLKPGCESLIEGPEKGQTLTQLVGILSQLDRCHIFKKTSENKLAVHEDIDREVTGFKAANYLRFTAQIDRLIEGARSSIQP